MSLITFSLCFDTEAEKFVAVNTETGEIKDFVAPSTKKTTTTTTKKKKKDESDSPQLILSENKYTLNTAAIELMGVEPEAKLNVKMRKIDGIMTPVLGTDEAFNCKSGNRLTKSFTVACRGANNDALASYGTVFELEANSDGTGTFILRGDKTPSLPEPDENISSDVEIPEELNVDLATLDNDIPEGAEEITGDDFAAMLSSIE